MNKFITDYVFVSVVQQKVIIPNKYGEKLVGVLHETESSEVVILCHGFRSTKVGVCNLQSGSSFLSISINFSSFQFD